MNKHSMFLLLSLVSVVSSVKSAAMIPAVVGGGIIAIGAIHDSINSVISKEALTPASTPVSTTPVSTTSVFEGRHIVTQEEVNALQPSYVTSALKAVKDNPALTAGVVAATVIVGICVYNRKAIKKAFFGKAASRKVVVA